MAASTSELGVQEVCCAAQNSMHLITIQDLGVLCHIGVPEEERSKPQRLLVTAEIEGDFSQACASDDLTHTIDYGQVCERIRGVCEGGSFRLIETLAYQVASTILTGFGAQAVTVEVKKFIIPEARYISFKIRLAGVSR